MRWTASIILVTALLVVVPDAQAASRVVRGTVATAPAATPAVVRKAVRKAPRRVTWNVPRHWHKGFGFLPGFSPAERRERAYARWREERRGPYYIYGGPGYWSSFSRPGFYRSRWNGGGMGPCWTRTPIGAAWNCG